MSIEQQLSLALSRIGYARKDAWVYKLERGTNEVEHFLYFVSRPEKSLIAAQFGFRNPDAERFSIEKFIQYADKSFPIGLLLRPYNCSMQFSFGWFWSMERPSYWDVGSIDWAENVCSSFISDLKPFTDQLFSLGKMFETLCADTSPCPWIATNSAIRIAQISYLGEMIGKSREQVKYIANIHLNEIKNVLRPDISMNGAEDYISSILDYPQRS